MWSSERSAAASLTPGRTATKAAMGPGTGLPCWLRSVGEKRELLITAPVPMESVGSPDPPIVGRVAVPTMRRGTLV